MYKFLFLLLVPNLMLAQKTVNKGGNCLTSIYDSLFLSNDWRKLLDSEMIPVLGSHWKEKIAKVGDNVEGLIIGEQIMNGSGLVSLKIHSKKHVILDFWNTGCPGCISAFPKMEKIQEMFRDQVQIYLVNCWETESEVRARLEKRNIKIPNLPIIIGTKELSAVFPATYIPHHAWIDNNGIVRMIGPDYNTYPEKIRKFINGEPFDYLQSDNTVPAFNENMPYWKIIGKTIPNEQYFSFFTSFNNNYSTIGSKKLIDHFDTLTNSIRKTFINNSLFDLLRFAFKNDISPDKNIYPSVVSNIYLNVKDTTLITDIFMDISDKTDKIYIRNKYCYEQIMPAKDYSKNSLELMKEDLLKHCDNLGFNVSLKSSQGIVQCLTRLKKKGKPEILKIASLQKRDTFEFKSKTYVILRNTSVKDAIKSSMNHFKLLEVLGGLYFVDELRGYVEPIVVKPMGDDLKDWLRVLNEQGYLIRQKKLRYKMLEVSDK